MTYALVPHAGAITLLAPFVTLGLIFVLVVLFVINKKRPWLDRLFMVEMIFCGVGPVLAGILLVFKNPAFLYPTPSAHPFNALIHILVGLFLTVTMAIGPSLAPAFIAGAVFTAAIYLLRAVPARSTPARFLLRFAQGVMGGFVGGACWFYLMRGRWDYWLVALLAGGICGVLAACLED